MDGPRHYLGFRQLVGESLKYVALLAKVWVARIGWGAAALAGGVRDAWVGWSPEQSWRRLRFVANNQRCLILRGVRVKNLASKVLALKVRRLSRDWQASCNHPLLLAETLVDERRFAGTCYLAAGGSKLGRSLGYGRAASITSTVSPRPSGSAPYPRRPGSGWPPPLTRPCSAGRRRWWT